MLKGRIAELILSLAMPADRATGMVGDLMEDYACRPIRFWAHVGRALLSYMLRQLCAKPFHLLLGASFGWVGYLVWSGLVAIFVGLVTVAAWAVVYVLMHHAGIDALKLRFEWFPPPDSLTLPLRFVVKCMIVPFGMGRSIARKSPGTELACWIAFAAIWPWLQVIFKMSMLDLPTILSSLLAGILWQRWLLLNQRVNLTS